MNILIANTQEFAPQIGGVERASTVLAEKLIGRGHTVCFLACIKSEFSGEYIPVVEQKILKNSVEFTDENNISDFKNYLIEKEIEVILNQAGNILAFTKLCYEAKKGLNIRLISAIHTNPNNRLSSLKDFKFSKVYKNSFLKAVRRVVLYPFRYYKILQMDMKSYKAIVDMSDKIVLLSNFFKDDFLKLVGKDCEDKLTAISNLIPFSTTDCEFKKEKTILFVGRLDFTQKRPDRLVQIWERIYPKYPDWKLKIVGDGPNKNELLEYVRRKNIKNIEFLGFCDPIEYYKKSEILCVTSTIEGLPMVLIEGVLFGCIPIAFESFKSINDVIEDNKNGFIIKPYNLKEYENKLCMLMDDGDLREKMREEVQKIIEKFDIDAIVPKWLDLFNKGKI